MTRPTPDAGRFSLTEEQDLFRKSVRDFVDKEVVPTAAELDERGEFPMKLFRQCGQLGYFGLRYPESVGGLGADFTTFCLMAEEIARGSLRQPRSMGLGAIPRLITWLARLVD